MASIRERPVEAEGCLVPGHWEGDFIKGEGLPQRRRHAGGAHQPLVVLARMGGVGADAALEGFARKLRAVPACLRKTLAYGQGEAAVCLFGYKVHFS